MNVSKVFVYGMNVLGAKMLRLSIAVSILCSQGLAADEHHLCGTFGGSQGVMSREGNRPTFDYSIESATLPFTVHATSSSSADYARRILSFAETSWHVIVDDLGFRSPLGDHGIDGSDRIDIYIRGDLAPGVGGYTGFSGFESETRESDAYGYLVIAENLREHYIRGVVAHEFFHLVQMSYDWFEHPGFMEATAVWITDHVFDDENFYQNYYAYFNQSPFQSLDKISLADPYQYGAGLWFQFLDERFGQGNGVLIRQLWELSIQEGYDNTRDYFMAMRENLGGRKEFDDAFRDFGRWRLRVGSLSGEEHLREANSWPERVIPKIIDLGELLLPETEFKLAEGLQPYSHYFVRLRLPPSHISPLKSLSTEIISPVSGEITADLIKVGEHDVIIVLTRTYNGDDYLPDRSSEQPESVVLKIRKTNPKAM